MRLEFGRDGSWLWVRVRDPAPGRRPFPAAQCCMFPVEGAGKTQQEEGAPLAGSPGCVGGAWAVQAEDIGGCAEPRVYNAGPNASLPPHPTQASLRPLPAPPFTSPTHLFKVFILYTKWPLFKIMGRLLPSNGYIVCTCLCVCARAHLRAFLFAHQGTCGAAGQCGGLGLPCPGAAEAGEG